MPASDSHSARWRDSWPPTQVHLQPPAQVDNGLAASTKAEVYTAPQFPNNPAMTSFPTPDFRYTTGGDDGAALIDDEDVSDSDDELMDFDFDAGIEGASRPVPIVRAVSPSSLNSISLPEPRPPTPPRSRALHFALHVEHPVEDQGLFDDSDYDSNGDSDDDFSISDDDDDAETFVRFGSGVPCGSPGQLPFNVRYSASLNVGKPNYEAQARASTSPRKSSLRRISSCSSLSATAACARDPSKTMFRCGTFPPYGYQGGLDSFLYGGGIGGGLGGGHGWRGEPIARHQSPRSWRPPSPAVYSIMEETEEDLANNSPLGPSTTQAQSLDLQLKKQVRFALPRQQAV